MVICSKYVVLKPFIGEPTKENFDVIKEKLPPIKGGEILCQALYFSVDPYQKLMIGTIFPCDMIGEQIARVIESKHPEYPVGCNLFAYFGWRTHTIINPDHLPKGTFVVPYMYKVPEFDGLPLSLAIGVLGRVGLSAYCGLLDICKPKPGEVLVVTSAAGAVGSHVGQIAKIKGCKVIGFTGTDVKCKWLIDQLGYDHAFNYNTVDIVNVLDKCTPDGVDCYFDNVGGEISSKIISRMRQDGRVACCGAISAYSAVGELPKASIIQIDVISKALKIQGFHINNYVSKTQESIQHNLKWIKEGKLKYRETIYDGFESAVDAFVGIFKGENISKTIVEL